MKCRRVAPVACKRKDITKSKPTKTEKECRNKRGSKTLMNFVKDLLLVAQKREKTCQKGGGHCAAGPLRKSRKSLVTVQIRN